MNRLKPVDKTTILRLGEELAHLECLAAQIHFDLEYLGVTPAKDWDKFFLIESNIRKVQHAVFYRAFSSNNYDNDVCKVFHPDMTTKLATSDAIATQRNAIKEKYPREVFIEQ